MKPVAPFLLASGSPRRREMIAWLGWLPQIKSVAVHEEVLPDEKPEDMACRLATAKAEMAARTSGETHLILGVDTIVVDRGEVLGKPKDPSEAWRMLRQLRGKTHHVVSGLAMVDVHSGHQWIDVCTTAVPMRQYVEGEMRDYVAAGHPFDKAGGYGIQDEGFSPVDQDRFEGCFANVMGLPLCHLTRMVGRIGIEFDINVPTICAQQTGYNCQVYSEILRISQ